MPRERHLPPPPWILREDRGFGGGERGTRDPAALYRDTLVAIDGARGINNGEPSLHALLLAAAAPGAGERAIHVGAGTGYYTAILAELVGPAGRVDAYETEADLAALAAATRGRS